MYKNIIRAAFLFATGIFMTACSSGDDNFADNTTPVTPDTQKNIITLTGTINIGSSDISRAVDKEGNVTWTEGDKVYVAYEQNGEAHSHTEGTIIDVNGKEATFTATLENPKDNGRIGLAYPSSKVNNYTNGSNFSFDFNYGDLDSQTGTPESITANKLDFASSETDVLMNVPASGGRASIRDNITLLNQVCLCEFSLKVGTTTPTETWSPLSATKLEIMLDGNSTATYTITPAHSTDVFYVVMQPVSGQTVSLKATYTSAAADGATVLNPENVLKGDFIAVNPNENTHQAYRVSSSNIVTEDNLTKEFSSSTKLNKGKFYKQDVKYTTTKYLPVAVIAHVGAITNYCSNFLALGLSDLTSDPINTTEAASPETAATISTWIGKNILKIGTTTYDDLYPNNYDEVPESPQVGGNNHYASEFKDSQTRSTTGDKGWRVPSVTDFRYIIQSVTEGRVSATTPKGVMDFNGIYELNSTNPHNITQSGYGRGEPIVSNINALCHNSNFDTHYYWTSSKLLENSEKGWRFDFDNNHFIWNQASPAASDMAKVRLIFAY